MNLVCSRCRALIILPTVCNSVDKRDDVDNVLFFFAMEIPAGKVLSEVDQRRMEDCCLDHGNAESI